MQIKNVEKKTLIMLREDKSLIQINSAEYENMKAIFTEMLRHKFETSKILKCFQRHIVASNSVRMYNIYRESLEGNNMKQLKNNERKIKFIEANMKFEGFCISDQSKETCTKILKGEISGDDVVKTYICKHKKDL